MVYICVALVVYCCLVSLAVDYGRVQIAKSQLQQGCDAAARYGAAGLKNILNGTSSAAHNVVASAADNKVDGTPLVIDPLDVQLVIWNPATKSYTVTTDPALANGVRVSAYRTAARGNPIPLIFGKIFGVATCNVTATSIATYSSVGGGSWNGTVYGTDNPFLAGMPNGSTASLNNPHNSPDTAPAESPTQVTMTITPGKSMTFDGINGNAGVQSGTTTFDADGNPDHTSSNSNGSENGIATINGPLSSIVGVFLSASQPSTTGAPPPLDFTSGGSQDFSVLQPQLKQIFFIGDGRTSDGSIQQFVVPSGATRLFLGTWDSFQWNNNVGSFSVSAHNSGAIVFVK